MRLGAEDLDDLLRRQRLREPREERAHLGLVAQLLAPDAAADLLHRHEGDERQPQAHHHDAAALHVQADERADEHHGVGREVDHDVHQQRAQVVEVVGEAREQLAAVVGLVEAHRERHEPVEERRAHLLDQLQRDGAHDEALHVAVAVLDAHEHDQRHAGPGQLLARRVGVPPAADVGQQALQEGPRPVQPPDAGGRGVGRRHHLHLPREQRDAAGAVQDGREHVLHHEDLPQRGRRGEGREHEGQQQRAVVGPREAGQPAVHARVVGAGLGEQVAQPVLVAAGPMRRASSTSRSSRSTPGRAGLRGGGAGGAPSPGRRSPCGSPVSTRKSVMGR